MGQRVRFFEKNFIDVNNDACTIVVNDTTSDNNGQDIVNFLRNRNNTTAWVTSGSSDAANTQLVFNFGSSYRLDSVILVDHNFKNYLVEYYDGANWVTISNTTNNTESTTFYQFTEGQTEAARITIYNTMAANDNKRMFQAIFTRKFETGQLESWAEISGSFDQKKKVTSVLSGKANITQSVGAFTVDLKIKSVLSVNDLYLFQEMYDRYYEGFLMWISGGEESQFTAPVKLWRNKDLMLVKPIDNYESSWFENLYKSGMPINIRLREVIR